MEKSPPKKPPSPRSASQKNGLVTVSVTRKHSVRQFETVDVSASVTSEFELGETQSAATRRVYDRLKEDLILMSQEILQLAKNRDL